MPMVSSMMKNLLCFTTFILREIRIFHTIITQLSTLMRSMNQKVSVAEFRFCKRDVRKLSNVLQIPDTIICDQRSICDGIEGVCILLKRMSYPCRYGDMIHRFAKPMPVLSMINNHMIDYIYDTHGHKVLNWNHEILSPVNLQTYVNAIKFQSIALPNGIIGNLYGPVGKQQPI